MKRNSYLLFILIAALPAALFASSDTDRKIEDAAKASYNYRTVLENHVSVKADAGVVTLSGVVLDKDDKALAQDTVENLPGVTRVENLITVEPGFPEHSDAWIAFKIRSRLLMKSNVSAVDTKVAVNGGIVTLTGTTRNLAQKELTEAYVKDIDNVKSVKNELIVNASADSDPVTGMAIDDASITGQAKYALSSHRSTSVLKAKIMTNDGNVIISGEAASPAEISFVTKLIGDVRGVKSVTNKMEVK